MFAVLGRIEASKIVEKWEKSKKQRKKSQDKGKGTGSLKPASRIS
jgi:hypothetical protein